jgi:hypothetical protein
MKNQILIASITTAGMFGTTAHAASVIGLNLNNNDGAGAQVGQSTFGATWTDVTGANGPSGADLVLNGTSNAVNADWAASNFWLAGSWTGTDGFNSGIGTMRAYLDDGDNPAAGSPVDLGAANGDGIGVSIRLEGLATWLANEGATGYTITVYQSTDSENASFRELSIRDGGSVASSVLDTLTVTAAGNGTWDGTSNDPLGNITSGTRGAGTFSSTFNQDVITLTSASRSGSSRGTVAAVVVTAVPEPGSLALLGMGGLAFVRRRR